MNFPLEMMRSASTVNLLVSYSGEISCPYLCVYLSTVDSSG